MSTTLLRRNADEQFPSITYKEIEKEFEQNAAWGLLTCIDLSNCNPELVRSEKDIKRFVEELCVLIDMKRFGETQVVHFGEDEKVAGFSMVQLIETSLISGHFVNINNNVYIDIFSCKIYDPAVAAEFTSAFFQAESCTHKAVLRR